MPVHDLWKGLSPTEMLKKRAKNAVRYQRRWRDGTGRGAMRHKQSYPESPRAQAYIDEARQQAAVRRSPRPGRVTVSMNVHGLRHAFAAVALGELGADLISVSRALGHSRPSTTLNHYGHLAPAGLETLMDRVDSIAPLKASGWSEELPDPHIAPLG